MTAYQEKFDYLCNRQNWRCPIALEKDIITRPTDLHHKFHKPRSGKMVKVIQKKLYLFIDSLLNLVAVNHDWHLKYPSYKIITWHNALLYEDYLRRNKKCCEWVNELNIHCEWVGELDIH